ncbi:uncharacterized protein LOC131236960 isoform X3 [Magnolia sinica]|uniref:uncharacterized protein LOC131236960 isoform X3 n=1 Tax=Magnolia sinica TaxID=86752 RepID=UPI002658D5CE|nr:uncharacterized protein LOC131236960 isoform X3 [Magnolia sinica]
MVTRSAVFYHYPCPDGAFAALAAHLYFKAVSRPVVFFPNPVFDPIRTENLPLDEFDDVYMLDFVGPPCFVREISSKVRSVIILDHHKTALETLRETTSIGKNVTKIIDMERSGATIAYDFFKEKLLGRTIGADNHIGGDVVSASCGQLVPESELERVNRLFKYIEDGDLWRWALPDSKAFSSGMKDLNVDFNARLNVTLFDQAVNADSVSNLRSELGHQLADKSHNLQLRGIGAVVYMVPELENNQLLKISLRSVGNEDTTPISQKYGGGGHQNASSFMLSSAEFEKWKVGVRPLA